MEKQKVVGFFSRKGGWFHFPALADMGPLQVSFLYSISAILLFDLDSDDALPKQGCLQVN